ncbi:MAG: type II and III secretion system protein family protein [Candidatus Korobacteraceae bacterium]
MGTMGQSKKRLGWQFTVVLLLFGALFFADVSTATAQQEPPSPAATSAPPAAQAPSEAPPAAARQSGANAETVHIVVGHSLVVNTPSRVKRVLTGNPEVIESVVTSPEELVVTAKKPGSSSLVLWSTDGRVRALDVYGDMDVSSLRSSLEQSFPSAGLDVQSEGDKVVLNGTAPNKEVAEQAFKMASTFSKEVVNGLLVAPPPHERQVMLKVRFAEADRSKVNQFGVNLFSTGATNTIGTVSTQQFSPLTLSQNSGQSGVGTQLAISDLLNIFLFRPDINLGATIQLLQQKNVLQILAEPNLMAYSGQPAHFLAGGEFPYPVVQATAVGIGGITIQFKPYGVKLEFIATVEDNDTIRLKVAPEVSSLDYTNAVVISGFTMPAIQTRKAETEIELKNGQSFGIAGLLDERTTVQLSKVPGIGDIPILGEIFKSRSVNKANSELIVLVTPTIVDPVRGVMPNGPAVQQPIRNMNNGEFDKGLPTPNTAPESK